MSDIETFMQEAITLSREKMRAGLGGPFGAVIVKDGEIIGRGHNEVTVLNDPTAHAEVSAIRDACQNLATFNLTGAEIYTSCEPCPMCLAAIYWARISRIYYANTREDAAAIGFDDEFLYEEMKKDLETRSIPIKQIELSEAKSVFDEWRNKDDKIPY